MNKNLMAKIKVALGISDAASAGEPAPQQSVQRADPHAIPLDLAALSRGETQYYGDSPITIQPRPKR